MKRKSQKRSQHDIKNEAIFEAGKRVFLKFGFKSSSMDEIAREACVSKRTIYQHYGNKEALFQAVLSKHWEQVFAVNDELFIKEKSISENLKSFASTFLNFLYKKDTIDLFRILISESNLFPSLTTKLLVDDKPPFTKQLIEFLKAKDKTGEIYIKNAERSASYFLGLLKEYHFWPMMLGFTKEKQQKNQNVLIDEAIRIFLKGHLKSG
ncbi:MAG: TetR/AcrR family transcriptional regulator [Proteobacteria bacterium]|nr:TetR/AcrR family transcriptional regulator [Pseudomonadota bacterium]